MFRNRGLVVYRSVRFLGTVIEFWSHTLLITGAAFPSSGEDWHRYPGLMIGLGEHTCRLFNLLTLNFGLRLGY